MVVLATERGKKRQRATSKNDPPKEISIVHKFRAFFKRVQDVKKSRENGCNPTTPPVRRKKQSSNPCKREARV
jgi:hypothetical protein